MTRGETPRSNSTFQPHKFTSYERDANSGDEAMMRRYENRWVRFSQPDPYDGSYDLSDPQSFNRYSYTENDPVNFVDPSGLDIDYTIPAWQNGWSQMANPTLTFMNGALRDFIADYNWFVREEVGGVEISGFFTEMNFGQQPAKRACELSDTRLTHYDSPKHKTAISHTGPKEGRTAAADPEMFGFPYPRDKKGDTEEQLNQNREARESAQAKLKGAGISFFIPGKGILYFEDVGGKVKGNHIDVYVNKNARSTAQSYNKKYGETVNVIAFIPLDMHCPLGSVDVTDQF